jgi:hypothetical protein
MAAIAAAILQIFNETKGVNFFSNIVDAASRRNSRRRVFVNDGGEHEHIQAFQDCLSAGIDRDHVGIVGAGGGTKGTRREGGSGLARGSGRAPGPRTFRPGAGAA